MIRETYKRHLGALLTMVVAIVSWLAMLRFLPNPVTVYCSFSDDPVFAADPMVPFAAMCGFMLLSHAVIVLIDLFLFARTVPGYIMAAVDWIVEGVTAVFYLSILGAAAAILPCIAGLIIGAAAMLVVLGRLYRKAGESADTAAAFLTQSPYFEHANPSLLARVVFFVAPLFPRYIVIAEGGIRIIGVLYDVTYPWERIAEVKAGDFFSFFSNRPIKLNQTLTNTVAIRLKDHRTYPLISVRDRDRFLSAAAGFMAKR